MTCIMTARRWISRALAQGGCASAAAILGALRTGSPEGMTVAGESHHRPQRQVTGTGQTHSQMDPSHRAAGVSARHGAAHLAHGYCCAVTQPRRCAALPRMYWCILYASLIEWAERFANRAAQATRTVAFCLNCWMRHLYIEATHAVGNGPVPDRRRRAGIARARPDDHADFPSLAVRQLSGADRLLRYGRPSPWRAAVAGFGDASRGCAGGICIAGGLAGAHDGRCLHRRQCRQHRHGGSVRPSLNRSPPCLVPPPC